LKGIVPVGWKLLVSGGIYNIWGEGSRKRWFSKFGITSSLFKKKTAGTEIIPFSWRIARIPHPTGDSDSDRMIISLKPEGFRLKPLSTIEPFHLCIRGQAQL
jgi:hypothetical protein